MPKGWFGERVRHGLAAKGIKTDRKKLGRRTREVFVDAYGRDWPIFLPGEGVRFTYRCWESEESCDARLWHRTGRVATIVRRLSPEEVDEFEIGPMYQIRFSDGFVGDVGSDELEEAG